MSRFRRWFPRRGQPDSVLIINGLAVSTAFVRLHAQGVRDHDWQTPAERGMAIALIAALDELDHEGGPVLHEVSCPACGAQIRARMADK